MDKDLKKYQLAAFISPLLDEKQQKEFVDKFKKWISDNEGEVADEKISKKSLSYEIKHFQDAFYVLLNFSLTPDKIVKIAEKLKLENDILRYMILTVPKKKVEKKKAPKIARKATKQDLLIEKFIDKDPATSADKDKMKETVSPELKEKPVEDKGKLDLADLDKKLDEILSD